MALQCDLRVDDLDAECLDASDDWNQGDAGSDDDADLYAGLEYGAPSFSLL